MAVQQSVVTSVVLQVSLWIERHFTLIRSYYCLHLADEMQTAAQEGSFFLGLFGAFFLGVAQGVGSGLRLMIMQTMPRSSVPPKCVCCFSAMGESRGDLLPL